ncbi:MAG: hypothetical protein AAFR44_04000, partial [Pseudomonadota bacterium]
MEFLKRLISSPGGETREEQLDALVKQIHAEMKMAAGTFFVYDYKPTDSETYKALKSGPAAEQTALAQHIFTHRNRLMVVKRTALREFGHHPAGVRLGFPIFRSLMRGALALSSEEVLGWAQELAGEARGQTAPGSFQLQFTSKHHIPLHEWPIALMVQTVERNAKKVPLTPAVLEQLQAILDWPEMRDTHGYYGTDFSKVATRIKKLLGEAQGVDVKTLPYKK